VKYLFTILIGLALAIGLAMFLEQESGLFIFSYAGYTVQMSFALFVIFMFFTVVTLYFLLAACFALVRLPGKYRRWSKHRSYRRSEKHLMKGMLMMMEGRWNDAEINFRKGASYSTNPVVNYLFAARAAQQSGAVQRRDSYLRLAHELSSESSIAVGLTQAELQLSQHQTELAYATLKHLDENRPDQSRAKHLLLEAGLQLKEWQSVIDLLKGFDRSNYLPPEKIHAGRIEAYAGLLRKAANQPTREKLLEIWKNLPRKLQADLYLIEVYVSQRLKYPNAGDCEPVLRRALKKQWDAGLVRLYGLVESMDQSKQLAFAERMLANHARDPVLLLTLGRLCIRAKLWGKAKTYLEESIDIQPDPEAYQELAILSERQGDHATAMTYYQEGLYLATGASAVGIKGMLQSVNEGMVSDD